MAQTSMFVKLVAQPGRRDDVLAALDKMLVAVADESGTLVYTVHLDNADENVVWMFEYYESEDAQAAHSASAAMKALMGDVGSLLGEGTVLAASTPHAGKGLPA
jgi:quinol monooxygenase YgiN